MKIPLAYSIRNLWTRRLTTGLTVGGVALVVFVFVATLMLAHGLRETLVGTGSDDNVIFIRKASQTEVQSFVTKEQADILAAQPEIAQTAQGKSVVSKDMVVLIGLPKRGSTDPNNVIVRGVHEEALMLRAQHVHLVEGRMYRAGVQEVIIGKAVAKSFAGADLGKSLRMAGTEWSIVGIFDGHRSGFDSEIWGDVNVMAAPFDRSGGFSSVTVRLRQAQDFAAMKARLESDPRLPVDIKLEKQYYDEQSEIMARFIRVLGSTVTIIFSFGAMIGAMITMYAAVANRTQEIGTLRALGFRRRSVLGSFLLEALLLAFVGGCFGVVIASLLQWVTISTTNWGSFSEISFGFKLSPEIIVQALVFAVVMGIGGGFLPAVRSARLRIIEALRAI